MHLYLNSCEKGVIGCLQKSLKFLLLLSCYILRLIKSLSCGRIRFVFSVHERVSGMSLGIDPLHMAKSPLPIVLLGRKGFFLFKCKCMGLECFL